MISHLPRLRVIGLIFIPLLMAFSARGGTLNQSIDMNGKFLKVEVTKSSNWTDWEHISRQPQSCQTFDLSGMSATGAWEGPLMALTSKTQLDSHLKYYGPQMGMILNGFVVPNGSPAGTSLVGGGISFQGPSPIGLNVSYFEGNDLYDLSYSITSDGSACQKH